MAGPDAEETPRARLGDPVDPVGGGVGGERPAHHDDPEHPATGVAHERARPEDDHARPLCLPGRFLGPRLLRPN